MVDRRGQLRLTEEAVTERFVLGEAEWSSLSTARSAAGEVRERLPAAYSTSSRPSVRELVAHRALLKRAGRCSNQGRGVGTGPQLIWSGRPDAIGRSELGVQWSPPDARARYRVYLGDERVLSAALGLTVDASQPRAERAFTVWQRQAQLAGKESFSLLTEEPIGADGDGVVRFRHQLPAGLRGVQFLRVVPVSAAQVEAEFSACGSFRSPCRRSTDRPRQRCA